MDALDSQPSPEEEILNNIGPACVEIDDSNICSIFMEPKIPSAASLFHHDNSVSSHPIATVSVSGWNPPQFTDVAKGVLSYLEITVQSGPSVLVSSTVNGFKALAVLGPTGQYRMSIPSNAPIAASSLENTTGGAAKKNKSNKKKNETSTSTTANSLLVYGQCSHSNFAAVPPHDVPNHLKPKYGSNTVFSSIHHLLSVVVSSVYPTACARQVHAAPHGAKSVLDTTVRLLTDLSVVAFPHIRFAVHDGKVPAVSNGYSSSRAMDHQKTRSTLLAGCGGPSAPGGVGREPGVKRDWRQDFNELSEFAKNRSNRPRLLAAMAADWQAAAVETAKAAAMGGLADAVVCEEQQSQETLRTMIAGEVLVVSSISEMDSQVVGSSTEPPSIPSDPLMARLRCYSRKSLKNDFVSCELLRCLDTVMPRVNLAEGRSLGVAACDENMQPVNSALVDVSGQRYLMQSIIPGALTSVLSLPILGNIEVESEETSSKFDANLFAKSVVNYGRSLGLRTHQLKDGSVQLWALEAKATDGNDGQSYLIDVTRVTPADPEAAEASYSFRPELIGKFLTVKDERVAWTRLIDADESSNLSTEQLKDEEDEEQVPPYVSLAKVLAKRLLDAGLGNAMHVDFSFRRLEIEAAASEIIIKSTSPLLNNALASFTSAHETYSREASEMKKVLEERKNRFESTISSTLVKMKDMGRSDEDISLAKEQMEKKLNNDLSLIQARFNSSSASLIESNRQLEMVRSLQILHSSEIERFKTLMVALRSHSDFSKEGIVYAPIPLLGEDSPCFFSLDSIDEEPNNNNQDEEESEGKCDEWTTNLRNQLDLRTSNSWMSTALSDAPNASSSVVDIAAWAKNFEQSISNISFSYPQPVFNLNAGLVYGGSEEDIQKDKNMLTELVAFKKDVAIPSGARDLQEAVSCLPALSCEDVKGILHRHGLSCRDLGLILQWLLNEHQNTNAVPPSSEIVKAHQIYKQRANVRAATIRLIQSTILARTLASVSVTSMAHVPTSQSLGAASRFLTLATCVGTAATTCRESIPVSYKSLTLADFRAACKSRLISHYQGVSQETADLLFSSQFLSIPSVRVLIVSTMARKMGVVLTPEGFGNLVGPASPADGWNSTELVSSSPAADTQFHSVTSKHIASMHPVLKTAASPHTLSPTVRACLIAASRLILRKPKFSVSPSVPLVSVMHACFALSAEILSASENMILATSTVSATPLYPQIALGIAANLAAAGASARLPLASPQEIAQQAARASHIAEAVYGSASPAMVTALGLRASAICQIAADTVDTVQVLHARLEMLRKNGVVNSADHASDVQGLLETLSKITIAAAKYSTETAATLQKCVRLGRFYSGSGFQIDTAVSLSSNSGKYLSPLWVMRMITLAHLASVNSSLAEVEAAKLAVPSTTNKQTNTVLKLDINAEIDAILPIVKSAVEAEILPYVIAVEVLMRLAGFKASKGDLANTEIGLELSKLALKAINVFDNNNNNNNISELRNAQDQKDEHQEQQPAPIGGIKLEILTLVRALTQQIVTLKSSAPGSLIQQVAAPQKVVQQLSSGSLAAPPVNNKKGKKKRN